MFLKRLVMNGFKSFAEKTTLEFPKGVTAIVGPNGSGKSNVIDAIRWLLGERDAKNLRGGRAEDLIFAGTSGKAKAGMASASMVFDNSSKFFPVEFNEVEIRREAERGGNSSYFLNKSEIRLKDLVEILSKSRLGTKGLIIIGQGNSDLFIKASPAERREMVEEMLGLREFRIKRMEAERKLKTTGFNLEKARALIEEIGPHLRILRRQTAKWEKREELERELKAIEDSYFGAQAARFQEEYLKTDPEINNLERKAGVLKRELIDLEKDLKKLEEARPQRGETEKLRSEREKLSILKNRMEKEIGGIEARIEIMEERKGEKGEEVEYKTLLSFARGFYEEAKNILKAGVDLVAAERILKMAASEGEKIFSSKSDKLERETEEMKKKLEETREELKKIDNEMARVAKEEAALAGGIESFTDSFKKSFNLVEEKRRAILAAEQEKNRIVFEKERWGMKIQDLREMVRQAGRRWEEFLAMKNVRPGGILENGETGSLSSNYGELERKMFRLRGELSAIGEVDEALKKEAEETEKRHEFLMKESEDLEGAERDLREAILELSEKIHVEFTAAMEEINREFGKFFELMFKGGKAKMKLLKPKKKIKTRTDVEGTRTDAEINQSSSEDFDEEKETEAGIELEVNLPKKKITSLDVLSGGERSLVSIAALFALISVSPPPFLVLDEVDAPLDERNALKFAEMVKDFSRKAQFVVVTHNRATMEAADVLYGVTLGGDGASKVVSLKLN